MAEKKREDSMRALGWTVVRWTWDEVSTLVPVLQLRAALTLASTLPPPRGSVV